MSSHLNNSQANDSHSELGHVIEPKVFRKILYALLVLTFITVVSSPSVGFEMFDFGSFNVVIAMFIATIKATLVVMIFMHMKYENKVTQMYLIFPIFLIFVMMAGIFIDNPFRDAMIPVKESKGKEISAESFAQSDMEGSGSEAPAHQAKGSQAETEHH